jgi:hypothetical protein
MAHVRSFVLARIALLLAAVAAPAASTARAAPPPNEIPLELFDDSPVGKPPEGWKTRSGNIADVYVVRAGEERHYLHADARDVSVSIGKEERFDVRRYPILTWRWRVEEVPKGGDERRKETGDSAAGVYVVFGGWPIPNTIKYVWSATLPVGTRLESPFAGQTKIVVLRSGPPQGTGWVEEQVNVLEDYRKFFGKDPDVARGIGILTDSDNTHSRAVADYETIVARAAPTGPPSASGAAAAAAPPPAAAPTPAAPAESGR